MDDAQYSNRELDSKFESVHGKLDSILTQTTKTNGRVSSLEKWQSYVLGFCACLTIIVLPTLFFLVKLWSETHR